MSADLVVPSVRELEGLTPTARWNLEDAIDGAKAVLCEFNDAELQRWVEVEGKTQTEIAEFVGRSQSQIGRRCARLGLQPQTNRGRPGITPTGNSDDDSAEVVDAEWIDDPPPHRRTASPAPEGPVHHFPDVVAADAESNLRTQTLHWFEQGLHVKDLLDNRRPLEPRSEEDRQAIQRQARTMERVAQRLKEKSHA